MFGFSRHRLVTSLVVAGMIGAGWAQQPSAGSASRSGTDKGHAATLNWVAPAGKSAGGTLRYNVYRADGKQSKGGVVCPSKFARISQVDSTATSYVDRTVKEGHIYCYKVTAETGHAESSATGVVVAVIPKDARK